MPIPVIHPGRVLLEHMLAENWTLTELASNLGVPVGEVRDLLLQFGDITPELATKIAVLMGTSEIYWLNLQANFDSVQETLETTVDLSPSATAP